MPVRKKSKAEVSPELNEIIYAVPSWILKRGMLLIVIVLLLILFISQQISYPDLLKTTMTLTREQGNDQKFYGKVKIPQQNINEIKLGQRAMVKLKSYPFQQYGIIEGKVDAIPDQAADTVFTAKILLLELKAENRSKHIHLKEGMIAEVEIILNESTLLQRMIKKW